MSQNDDHTQPEQPWQPPQPPLPPHGQYPPPSYPGMPQQGNAGYPQPDAPGQPVPQGAPGYPGGYPQQGYPGAPGQGPGAPGRRKGLMWGLIAGGVVILIVVTIVLVVIMQQRAVEQAAADRAEAITGTVSGYLEAVASGDSEAALGFLNDPEPSPLLTDEALAASNEVAPIGDIDVPELKSGEEEDAYSWEVPASYTIGGEAVDTVFTVSSAEGDDDTFEIIGGLGSVTVPGQYAALGATVNGVAAEGDSVAVFPGAYRLDISDDRFTLSGESSVTVPAPYESGSFSEVEFGLTNGATKSLRSMVIEEAQSCVASTKLEAGCGLTMEKTINSGDVTLTDGTVKRSLPSATKSALRSLTFDVSYDNPLVVTSGHIGSVDLEADGASKSGASGRYELYFGGPSLGSVTIDLSGDEPEITWDD